MNTKLLVLRTIFVILILFGQSYVSLAQSAPPSGLTGETLRTWLKTNWYDSYHSQLGYNEARKAIYSYVDARSDTVYCVYSGFYQDAANVTFLNPINAEHTVPQSWFSDAEPMRSDIHHLYPTHMSVNGARSNYPFANNTDSNTDTWYTSNSSNTYSTTNSTPGSDIDSYSELDTDSPLNGASAFEPREDHKGNLARAVFYFYTMYPTQAGNMSEIIADGDTTLLYQWHLQDPVDADEITRNNRAEERQGNRNPYIDYPDLAADAWGFTASGNAPVSPSVSITENISDLTVAWGDVSEETGYKVYRSINNSTYTEVADLASNSTSYLDNTVSSGITYYYYVEASNANGSNVSNTVSGSLSAGGGGGSGGTELIISEYVEGSGNNKAIEIANFTGASVDLSEYSLRKETNGAGGFTAITLSLSGTLTNGDVYVIVNNSADVATQTNADLLDATVISFNGNDPIGLFKNGTLIDIVGTLGGGSANFGINQTLVRKPSINSPNTTYTVAEWDVQAEDDVSDLGSHTNNGSGSSGEVASELIISEYVEGSGNNKAIEIANFTGAPVDLSEYSLRKETNGAGGFTATTLSLSGTLANGDVYVIVNNSADVATQTNADLLDATVISFNGNDPIGLFKNGTLIDIVGTLGGGSANFGINQTLIRKATITSPNTTYTVAEWDSQPEDDVGNLGSHTMTLTPISTTWNGAIWSNGAPTASIEVIVDGNYTTGTDGDITCSNLTVNGNYTLTVSADDSVSVAGNIENSGSILVKNNGAFIQTASSPNNSGTGGYAIERLGADYHGHYNYWSSPVQNSTLNSIFGSTGRAFYTFDASTQSWAGANKSLVLPAGLGFIATGTSASPTTITRVFADSTGFNSGDLNYSVFFDGTAGDANENWNLIGNPYPSGLDVDAFLTNNTAVLEDAVYLWSSDGSDYSSLATDYATMNAAGIVNTGGSGITPTSATISACQGFIVQTRGAGDVSFSNSQRIGINNTFQKTSADNARIWLGVEKENGAKNEILIALMADADETKDKYDAIKFSGNSFISFYSIGNFAKSEVNKLAIQGLPALIEDKSAQDIPLGIEVKEAGEFTFSINHLDGFDTETDIYLHDKLNHKFIDLRKDTYKVDLPKGEFNDRFETIFITNEVTGFENSSDDLGVQLYVNKGSIIVQFTDPQIVESEISIYNLSGSVVFNTFNHKSKLSIPVPTKGIYIIHLVTKKGIINNRVFIK